MRVIGYVRVSTREQGDSGLGLAAQRRAIREEVARRGWTLLSVEEDVASGKRADNRPGLERALTACRRRQADGLMVAKLDRLSRSLVDFATVLEEAVRRRYFVVALDLGVDTSTETGELVANIMMSVARWERRIISRRVREGLAEKRAQGWPGPPPPPVPPKLISEAARSRIHELHRAGLPPQRIADTLNAEGVPAVGRCWHRSGVRRVLGNAGS